MENKELLIAQGYSRLDVEVLLAMQDIPQLDPDLMFVKFVMCHEGVNANGDTFTKEVLKNAQATPQYKPIDWEHGQPMIGHILGSEYKEDAQGVGYIEASGVIWKFIYPELSSQIKTKASTGELRLSMECYYKDANYRVGDQIFDTQQAEKLGIIPYVGREYMGKKVARVFKEVIFGGVGVVANPADKQAVFLAVAKDLGLKNEEAGLHPVNDFTARNHSSDSKNAVAVAKYVKAFDKAKSSVVAKFNTKTLKTKEQVVAEVRNSIQTLLLEVSSISNSYYYKGLASTDDNSKDDPELYELAEKAFENSIALNSDEQEAYLLAIQEDYVVYDIIDYSNNSVVTLKASFVAKDNEVEIDFANATQFAEREDNESMAKEKTVVASEVEAEVKTDKELNDMLSENMYVNNPKAKKSDEDSEDLKDGGEDEETEDDKEDAPKKKKASNEDAMSQLQAQLAEAQAQLAKFEARFAEMEADKVVASRISDLKDVGIVFSASRLEKEKVKLRSMAEEAYADYKELLVEVAGLVDDIKNNQLNRDKVYTEAEEALPPEGPAPSGGKKVFPAKDERDKVYTEADKKMFTDNQDELTETYTEADEEDGDGEASASVEIVVEGARASSLNTETPITINGKKPFSHLSRR
jgi:hypothetical protein